MSEQLATSALHTLRGFGRPERRPRAAAELARLFDADDLLVFAPDPELGVLLPGPGLPQTLRGANEWRGFLDRCRDGVESQGTLPGANDERVKVRGISDEDGAVAVLIGVRTHDADLTELRLLLPLLGALFRSERAAAAMKVRSQTADQAVTRTRKLAATLKDLNAQLGSAYAETEAAKQEAEALAEELQVQAAELEVQAAELEEQAAEMELLNDQLTTRSEEADRARAEADAANQAKSDFLATMSHELRTPINAIIGYAGLLAEEIAGPVGEMQRNYLDRIATSSDHLLGLINDILDLAKVEAGRLEMQVERDEITEAIEDAVALVGPQSAEAGLRMVLDLSGEPEPFMGDGDRARQILVNLLSNAVKFTPTGGTITVRAGKRDRPHHDADLSGPGPWTIVEVEDDGVGIGPENAKRIFEPFEQVGGGMTRSHGGTGLGLTISRQLARLMAGDLTLSSVAGEGSCFTLWLPRSDAVAGGYDRSILASRGQGQPLP